jgi:hypothetical protein
MQNESKYTIKLVDEGVNGTELLVEVEEDFTI